MDIPKRRLDAISNLERLISKKGYSIETKIISNTTIYFVKNNETEIGYIELTCLDRDYEIATYNSNRWFGNSSLGRERAINIAHLVSHVRGMGKLILSYGVLKIWEQNPEVSYGILEDDSDHFMYKENNIYSALSFTPVYKAINKGQNTVELNGSEKQCLLSEFLDKAEGIIDRFGNRAGSKRNGNGSKRNGSNRNGSNRRTRSKRTGSKRSKH